MSLPGDTFQELHELKVTIFKNVYELIFLFVCLHDCFFFKKNDLQKIEKLFRIVPTLKYPFLLRKSPAAANPAPQSNRTIYGRPVKKPP